MSDRCEHVCYIGQNVRCDLPRGHDGEHRGMVGTINAWRHVNDPCGGDTRGGSGCTCDPPFVSPPPTARIRNEASRTESS